MRINTRYFDIVYQQNTFKNSAGINILSIDVRSFLWNLVKRPIRLGPRIKFKINLIISGSLSIFLRGLKLNSKVDGHLLYLG